VKKKNSNKNFRIYLRLVLILLLVFEISALILTSLIPAYNLKNRTLELSSEITSEKLAKWYQAYMKVKEKSANKPSKISLYDALLDYQKNFSDFNNSFLITLPELDINFLSTESEELDPPLESIVYPSFPSGEVVTIGVGEKVKQETQIIALNGTELKFVTGILYPGEATRVAIGNMNRAELAFNLREEVLKIQSDNNVAVTLFDTGFEDKEVLSDVEIGQIKLDVRQEKDLIAGKLYILDKNCESRSFISIIYLPESGKYSLKNPSEFDKNSCKKKVEVRKLACKDCKLAPVDKITYLPSSYVPDVVSTNLPGGGLLTRETVNALTKMSNEIYLKGMTVYVTSAYRSYEDQQNAFNSWVASEIAKGADKETAKLRANNYSAVPGHSEHQLGTTLDIRCQGCEAFSKDVLKTPLFVFLQEHAHEYGFVISYPQGKQHLTGYTYEPWHIRYIGVELATELFSRDYQNSNNNEYLSKFLREKNLY